MSNCACNPPFIAVSDKPSSVMDATKEKDLYTCFAMGFLRYDLGKGVFNKYLTLYLTSFQVYLVRSGAIRGAYLLHSQRVALTICYYLCHGFQDGKGYAELDVDHYY